MIKAIPNHGTKVAHKMLVVERVSDLASHVGQLLGTSNWLKVDQNMIDQFAEITGDTNWYHTDVDRARRDLPGGTTIAHGYLALSLIAKLSASIYRISNLRRSLNYGLNRLRFTTPIPAGSRVRLNVTLVDLQFMERAARLTFNWVVEIEHEAKPALIADAVIMAFE